MAHTSAGVISGSVAQLADVKAVLGESVNILSGLCKSSKINKWAKYKPVVYASNAPDRSGTAWWHGTNRNCSLTINTYAKASTLASGYTSNYGYVKPSGGTASPYRLLDFQGYNHKAPTLGMIYCGGEQDSSGRYVYYISESIKSVITFSFYEVASAINIMDLLYKNGGGLFTSSDTNLYCGIMVKQSNAAYYAVKMNTNALGVSMTASDLGSGKWNRSIQITGNEVTSLNTGVEYTVYPFVAPVHTYSQQIMANDYGFRSAPLPVAPIKLISATYASKLSGSFTAQTCKATTNAFQVTFTYAVVNSASSNVTVSGNATFYILSQTDIDTTGTEDGYYQGWKILGTKTFTVSFTATRNATTTRTHTQLVNQNPWVISSANPSEEEKVQFCLIMPGSLGTSYKRDITVS